jgi:WD40 repeat protein
VPVPPPEKPTEPAPVTCGELTAGVELAWVEVAEEYGLEGPGMLSFSPDGARLATVGGSYDPAIVLLEVETGTYVRQEVDEIVYGRDSAWRVELRGHDRGLHALDLLSGGDVFSRALEGVIRGAAVSGDGRFVGALTCRDGLLVASRWELGSDATSEVPLQPCDSLSLDHAFLLTRAGEAALVAAGTDGSVARVDFEHGTVTRATLHDRTEVTPSVFGLALSPDGTKGISAGTDAVRAWSHPALVPSFEPVPSTVGPTFTNCYTQSRYLSALAFSPDGSLLTTPAEGGALTIRRSCDLAPVATLERPYEPFCSYRGNAPAGLATFSPAGDRLAVWWGGVVGMYRVVH